MRAITVVDPFTYAVHGFKELVLKNTGLMAIAPDLLFLADLLRTGNGRSDSALPPDAVRWRHMRLTPGGDTNRIRQLLETTGTRYIQTSWAHNGNKPGAKNTRRRKAR